MSQSSIHAKQDTSSDRIVIECSICQKSIQRTTIIFVVHELIMSSYDPIALYSFTAQILALSAPDMKTKTAMNCAEFRSVDEEYNACRKRIE